MSTPKPPLTPQMQDALQRGDIRALMHALNASGGGVDLQAARRAMAQQLRDARQQAEAGRLEVSTGMRAAVEVARDAKHGVGQALQRRRPPTVAMGDRPGEMRWLLIVAGLLALAVWLAFGGP
ncbi:hypothetical protein MASR1M8_26620 [Thermomonas brevis]